MAEHALTDVNPGRVAPQGDDFRIYEAFLWEPSGGYFLLDEHLKRLQRSATHFRFRLDLDKTRNDISSLVSGFPARPQKVRLELVRNGRTALSHQDARPSTPVRVALAPEPVDSADEFLRHKTSRRTLFDRALASRPEAQDVLLWNERGELTETCHANLVIELAGRKLTPPISSGLLPGIFRAHLLGRGEIEEVVLPVASLQKASALFLINSVRRWCDLRFPLQPSPALPSRPPGTTLPG